MTRAQDSRLVSLENVTVAVASEDGGPEKLILKPLTGVICRGSRILVQGGNGSGKTTLLRVISGLIVPSSGTRLHHSGRICHAAQNPADDVVPELTVYENLLARFLLLNPKTSTRRQATQAIDRFLERLPASNLLAVYLDQPARVLSGGWQQILQVVACLIARRDMLLLDEPTSALSGENISMMYELLGNELGDTALVCVSHDPMLGARLDGLTATWSL